VDGMSDLIIRCESEDQYVRWLSACRLAARGCTMADESFETEVKRTQELLTLQRPAQQPAVSARNLQIEPEDYVPLRFVRKLGGKLVQRILESHANVATLNLSAAKLRYLESWQAQPCFGVSYFVVRFQQGKRDELLGVAANRLTRLDVSGSPIRTWRLTNMKAWNVNWEQRHMMVQFEEESIALQCLSADPKVVHEFIGGYVFLQLRSREKSQTLDRELFQKLTGGWT